VFNVTHSGLTDNPFMAFNIQNALNQWGADVGPLLANSVRGGAPVRTGRLRDSIQYAMENGGEGGALGIQLRIISYGVPYAGAVVFGAEPHPIQARAAKTLHFFWHGREMFPTRVSHPGNQPNRFPEEAYTNMRDFMLSRMLYYLEQQITQ